MVYREKEPTSGFRIAFVDPPKRQIFRIMLAIKVKHKHEVKVCLIQIL